MKKPSPGTSESSPLRIAEVAVGSQGGTVGMTLCPGKVALSTWGGSWGRDLEADIDVIEQWGARAVVTLLENHEIEDFQVTELGPTILGRGIEWHHLPIRDGAAPGEEFERKWAIAGVRIRQRLRAGHKILVHCRGGLGRAGTVSARLLVELGWDPESAIQEVRAARSPDAIERSLQEDHVRAIAPKEEEADERMSRIIASLLGGALGDALGYQVEFKSLDTIRDLFGSDGIRNPISHDKAVVSDDTQMALFALEGVIRAWGKPKGDVAESIQTGFQDWYSTQRDPIRDPDARKGLRSDPALNVARAPGVTCLSALSRGGCGTLDDPINGSKGCGTVMRVAPVGFSAAWLDEDEIFEVGQLSGAFTHGHPTAIIAAGALAVLIHFLVDGHPLIDSVERVLLRLCDVPASGEVVLALDKAIKAASARSPDPVKDIDSLWGDDMISDKSRGWVAEEAFAVAVYAALVGRDFNDAIAIAANHDGDSDSTAAICGNLYGAAYGLGSLDLGMANQIDVIDAFERLIYLLSRRL